mgnify:CR=1 FL=1|jgi:acyl carrier protein
MTPPELRAAFVAEIAQVAPDIDPATVADTDHIQDDLGLDSMDVLNLVARLHERLGVAIPEAEYREIATPARAVAYLSRSLDTT